MRHEAPGIGRAKGSKRCRSIVLIELDGHAPCNRTAHATREHRPIARDCADGRAAVKGAKLVLGIFRPSMYDEHADPLYGELLVLKNNQGEVNKRAGVRLDLATHTIRDLPAEPVKAEQQAMGV